MEVNYILPIQNFSSILNCGCASPQRHPAARYKTAIFPNSSQAAKFARRRATTRQSTQFDVPTRFERASKRRLFVRTGSGSVRHNYRSTNVFSRHTCRATNRAFVQIHRASRCGRLNVPRQNPAAAWMSKNEECKKLIASVLDTLEIESQPRYNQRLRPFQPRSKG